MRQSNTTRAGKDIPLLVFTALCIIVLGLILFAPVSANAADRLGNISTRGKVTAGAGRMRAGFIIQGDTQKCAIVRARGPSINFPGQKVADPQLTLMDNTTGQILATNDDWQDQPEIIVDKIIAEGLEPGDSKEAAIYWCFDPERPYTTIVEGANSEDVGIAIAEVMDADTIAEIQVADGNTAALQAQIDNLQSQINSLDSLVTALQAAAHTRYSDAEAVSAVGPHFSGNYNALYNKPSLASVAFTGAYSDLSGQPSLAQVATTGKYAHLIGTPSLAPVATSGQYSDLTGSPTLAAVATTGKYSSLSGTPNLAAVATTGKYTDLVGEPTLAAVATTGQYSDLAGTPTLAAVATTGKYTSLSGRPSLSTVATSGQYSDLTGRPNLATVATSGSYLDLSDTPSGSGTGTGELPPVLDYMSLVTIDGIPNVVFSSANVRVQSGGKSGRGNLIIGANDGCGSNCVRTGKENLIVGPNNEWKSTGGVIFGNHNAIDASWGTILGGAYNTITGTGTGGSIVTGTQNWVMTSYGAILGGKANQTGNLGSWSAILGGQSNMASGQYQTIWQ